MRAFVMVVIATVAGCGDDGGAPAAKPVSATPTAAATPGSVPGGGKGLLTEKHHVEERVNCPIPERPSDVKATCDAKAPSCPEHLYCLQLNQGTFCEPCPERESIRHSFKDRDFVAEQNRD